MIINEPNENAKPPNASRTPSQYPVPHYQTLLQCPASWWHIARLEEFNGQLARANDVLRRDRDRLAAQLAQPRASEREVA
jgi:hypothetical protein